ncbi:TetR/AcrR family transcriptional regulator [Altererythrobacter arenosus]|uniref:TetR/AcrR family transcriptional regulator n=1 Tax=Altererythrobacter arenosus TaxID=3032592 RepID=A0ABY8FVZ1_9SPHN|nr:TetR/AcrR family transcriptional regulator [Altererythrobacter sp. CAU 1644]WFL78138.1 TetR/AcrR family transcriptional regulator [Altererythrobacter sp. CAU 1644]
MDQPAAASDKTPRTSRGRRTLRKLLDAAAVEFGEKGFHEASISSITGRANVALGTFYTYFDSKDALFRALVADMSEAVKASAREAIHEGMGALEVERAALADFLKFAREHREIYRIIDEAEFVDPASYRRHYETIADRFVERLKGGGNSGELRGGLGEVHAWALMGMNVFVGLRYAVWGEGREDLDRIAEEVNLLIARGIEATEG